MRLSVIEIAEDYNGGVIFIDITYSSGNTIEDYEDFIDPTSYYKWKKSKDEGVKFYRESQSNTVIILETSPYYNLIMFDSVCLNSSVSRLKDYGVSDAIINLLAVIKVPIN